MMIRLIKQLAGVLLSTIILPVTVRAQECDTVVSRTSLSALSGRRIQSLRVVTLGPAPLSHRCVRRGDEL